MAVGSILIDVGRGGSEWRISGHLMMQMSEHVRLTYAPTSLTLHVWGAAIFAGTGRVVIRWASSSPGGWAGV